MASLPPIRKLYVEDYPTQKGWIAPFLLILNTFMQAVVSSFNKSLTLVENTTSDIKVITLSVPPTANAPVSVAWTKDIRPKAVIVGNVVLRSTANNTYTITDAVQVQWQMSQTNGSLQVVGVSGIVPSSTDQYTLTLVCIAG